MTKYDGAHRTFRRRLQAEVEAGRATCWRCGKPIVPGQRWHLGHDDSGRRWVGAEHERCNTRAAGRKGRAIQLARAAKRAPDDAPQQPRWSRHWYGGFDPRCPDCSRLGRACANAEAAG